VVVAVAEADTALALAATWANGDDSGNDGADHKQQNGRGSVDGGSSDDGGCGGGDGSGGGDNNSDSDDSGDEDDNGGGNGNSGDTLTAVAARR
jgi:hypothetical protein